VDFGCKILDRGIVQGVYASMKSRNVCIFSNAEALRGDDAGAFTIYAIHICHLWKDLELGKCYFCLPVLCLWRLARCVILLSHVLSLVLEVV